MLRASSGSTKGRSAPWRRFGTLPRRMGVLELLRAVECGVAGMDRVVESVMLAICICRYQAIHPRSATTNSYGEHEHLNTIVHYSNQAGGAAAGMGRMMDGWVVGGYSGYFCVE